MAKIVIVGAGSLVFSSRLTADILTYSALEDSHFTLLDVDEDRLNYAEQIVNKIFEEGKYSNATVSKTMNQREAFKGADYIIISILVGGYEAIKSEIEIPMKYGVDQCIGDTLTPGGIMRGLRTLPILLEMMKDIKELSPGAHVLNYTNPMGILSWGIQNAYPEISYIGLCHSVQGTSEEWAARLGINIEEINYECAGINHQAFFTKFEYNGEDLLPKIRKLAERPQIWYGDTSRMEYCKQFGYPVTESSGHVSEYNWWFRKNKETIKRYCNDKYDEWNGGSGFIKVLYERPDWKEQMEKMANWEEPVDLERSSEYGATIINSLETGELSLVYGNLKNRDSIENLPYEALVEVPCMVNKNGIQPVKVGKMPTFHASLNRIQLSVQELAVKAVETGDPEYVFQAMALDPLTAMSCTLDEIRDMTIELLEAHKPWVNCLKTELQPKKHLYKEPVPEKVDKHKDPATANEL